MICVRVSVCVCLIQRTEHQVNIWSPLHCMTLCSEHGELRQAMYVHMCCPLVCVNYEWVKKMPSVAFCSRPGLCFAPLNRPLHHQPCRGSHYRSPYACIHPTSLQHGTKDHNMQQFVLDDRHLASCWDFTTSFLNNTQQRVTQILPSLIPM